MAQVIEHLPSKCKALSFKKIKNPMYERGERERERERERTERKEGRKERKEERKTKDQKAGDLVYLIGKLI
jgi:hypothetical protein